MKDKQGILRGRCTLCNCAEYITPIGKVRCENCNHAPAKHENLESLRVVDLQVNRNQDTYMYDLNDTYSADEVEWESVDQLGAPSRVTTQPANAVLQAWDDTSGAALPGNGNVNYSADVLLCQFPGCNSVANYDLNMQQYTSPYCYNHISATNSYNAPALLQAGMMSPMNINPGKTCGYPGCGQPCYVEQDGTVHDYCCRSHAIASSSTSSMPVPMVQGPSNPPLQPVTGPGSTAVMTVGGIAKCAIPECNNPCFVDAQGKAFECCGYTHAMEFQRRKALATAPSVKGVTHCLLPECNNPVWPFMNYCGRTHADLGKQRGLQPPAPQDDQSTKPADCCIIPGCRQNKYVDSNGTVHPYCSKTHSEQGKRLGIFPKADQDSDQCDLPGCTRPKRKETDGKVHDYCCKDHSNKDAPNRDARILTPRSEVDKYLQKFSNLKVVKVEENSHAKPGGALFAKFKSKYSSLPKNQRTTQLAFHGTAEANMQSICSNGYDPSKRSGQAYGPGEYFAVNPTIPLGYCKGGKKLLLNELLLGQQGTHHTRHGDIVVMKDPAHDLPRYIITFQ